MLSHGFVTRVRRSSLFYGPEPTVSSGYDTQTTTLPSPAAVFPAYTAWRKRQSGLNSLPDTQHGSNAQPGTNCNLLIASLMLYHYAIALSINIV